MSLSTREHAIPLLFNGEEIPPKLPLTMGGSGPPSNTWLLGPTAPHTPNAISIEPAVSSRLTLHYPYTLLRDGPFPTLKLLWCFANLDSLKIDNSLLNYSDFIMDAYCLVPCVLMACVHSSCWYVCQSVGCSIIGTDGG